MLRLVALVVRDFADGSMEASVVLAYGRRALKHDLFQLPRQDGNKLHLPPLQQQPSAIGAISHHRKVVILINLNTPQNRNFPIRPTKNPEHSQHNHQKLAKCKVVESKLPHTAREKKKTEK